MYFYLKYETEYGKMEQKKKQQQHLCETDTPKNRIKNIHKIKKYKATTTTTTLYR